MSRCNAPAVYRQYQKGRHSFFSWELSSREGNLTATYSYKLQLRQMLSRCSKAAHLYHGVPVSWAWLNMLAQERLEPPLLFSENVVD
ncbi:hypothetical protein AVEN_67094-1 [Araneus ventricosus]|uniref:Uncharacterized protein n=1 Tax=Araneus ventricosus TaxID=182803 RepID=A0A4Y2FSN0_ARAVE|nr:hypothetical protein AVEN_67094-1 [Araneus ventricosus]